MTSDLPLKGYRHHCLHEKSFDIVLQFWPDLLWEANMQRMCQHESVWVSYIKRSVCTLAAVCSAHSPVLAHHMPERCGCTVIMHNSCRVIFQFKGHYQLQKEISKLSDYICQASLVFVPLARQKIVWADKVGVCCAVWLLTVYDCQQTERKDFIFCKSHNNKSLKDE